jgi:hypothetical protein
VTLTRDPVELGWIPPDRVADVNATGLYTLTAANQLPQNAANGTFMAIKIKKADEYARNPLPYFFFSFYHGENVIAEDK